MSSPADHLVSPVSSEPIPAALELALNLPDLTSASFLISEFLGLIDSPGPADLADWIAGDWERVALAADACRNLGSFSSTAAAGVREETGAVGEAWSGHAASAASGYFSELADKLDSNALSFSQIAGQLDQTAIGVHQAALAIGKLIDLIIDLGVAFLIEAAVAAASAATGVGAVATGVLSAGLVALIIKGYDAVSDVLDIHARASAICVAFVGITATPLATLKGFPEMSVPAPYSNPVVPS